ncbi:hypothetical protein BpHYR1_005644 [Brachionus plicatilis]|uniref:Uncharacterized protein n=1 Tax=Brachionus plicatilis TaxID=10195 RepID=A0A3M7SYW8_BRAPC|nr:hypothetical protein BpHYR1_005644 [Brachionus plicatilis]
MDETVEREIKAKFSDDPKAKDHSKFIAVSDQILFMLKLQENSDIWQIYCIRQPQTKNKKTDSKYKPFHIFGAFLHEQNDWLFDLMKSDLLFPIVDYNSDKNDKHL